MLGLVFTGVIIFIFNSSVLIFLFWDHVGNKS